jgi:tryptophanyl-tRNA synthetase
MKIKTNSQLPEEPKSTEGCALFQIYCAFSTVAEQADIATRYAAGGMGWGDMKQTLFEKINAEVAPFRDKYDALMANPDSIMDALDAGATKARAIIGPVLAKAKQHAGLM